MLCGFAITSPIIYYVALEVLYLFCLGFIDYLSSSIFTEDEILNSKMRHLKTEEFLVFKSFQERARATEEELIKFSKEKLAGFKTPKKVIFQELPKTSTGKIQKFELRKSFG